MLAMLAKWQFTLPKLASFRIYGYVEDLEHSQRGNISLACIIDRELT